MCPSLPTLVDKSDCYCLHGGISEASDYTSNDYGRDSEDPEGTYGVIGLDQALLLVMARWHSIAIS